MKKVNMFDATGSVDEKAVKDIVDKEVSGLTLQRKVIDGGKPNSVYPEEVTPDGYVLKTTFDPVSQIVNNLDNSRLNPGISNYAQYYDCRMNGKYGTYSVEADCKLYDVDDTLLGTLEDGGGTSITIHPATANGVRITGKYLKNDYWYFVDAICIIREEAGGVISFALQSEYGNPIVDIANIKKELGIPVLNHTVLVLENMKPNVFNVWGEVASLRITFDTTVDNTKANEYLFQFRSGATATNLSLPTGINWVTPLVIEANKTYQVSVLNNIGYIGGV